MKSRINATIDLDIALYYKANPDLNMSQEINGFLRLKLNAINKNISIIEAEEELERIKQERLFIEKKQTEALIVLQQAKLENENQRKESEAVLKEEAEELKLVGNFLKMNGRDLLG
jgi:hypothetical protein